LIWLATSALPLTLGSVLLALMSLYGLRPGTISLSIHQHGICYRSLLRTLELDWQDISEFHLFNIQRNPLIGYYSDSYLARLAQRSPLRAKARRVLQSLPANFERPAA
jgi:hypothetical protein